MCEVLREPVQRRSPVLVLNVDMSARIDEHLHDLHVTHLAGAEQRRVFEQVDCVDVGLALQQQLHGRRVTGECSCMQSCNHHNIQSE